MKKIFCVVVLVFLACGRIFAAVNLQDMDFSRVNPSVRIKDITEVEVSTEQAITLRWLFR